MKQQIWVFICLFPMAVCAQGPFDGYLKGRGNLDLAPSFSSNSASTYLARQKIYNFGYKGGMIGLFGEYGLTHNLDLIVNAAYVITSTQNGFQDGGLFFKYRFAKIGIGESYFLHLLGASGLSFPLSD